MADSDKTLSLLIQLGVIGKEDAAALKDLLGQTKDSVSDLSKSMPEGWEGMAKYKDALHDAGEAAHSSGIEHRALHSALDKLNEVTPGLGSSVALLVHGLMAEGEAAKMATVANEGFIASLGPIAVVILLVQAIVTWYKFLTEGSKDAGKAQEEAWKKNIEALTNARAEMEKYMEALAKARGIDSDYRAGLELDNQILDAQVEARRNVLKAMQDNELAQATSEEAKKAIRQKYADLDEDLDKSKAKQKIALAQQTIDRINADENSAMDQKEGLEDQRAIASRDFGAADPRARAYDKQIADLQDQIVKMEEEKKRLASGIGGAGLVADAANQGDVNRSVVQGDVSQAAKGIADIVSGGGVVKDNQQAFMAAFADDMAHRMGQLSPNQNFSNAQAAATSLENFFKTQHDPYNALFQQIHSAVIAAKANQDAQASFWLGKFQTLEAQVKSGGMNFGQ